MISPAETSESSDDRPLVSLICPAFDEAVGIAGAVTKLRGLLDALSYPAEVLIIDDGSRDDTAELAAAAIGEDRRFSILQHKTNFGRGRALRTGIQEARGEIIVTTEGDLSWGAEVVDRMVSKLVDEPDLDAVFASPKLPGGSYRNVPRHRVWISDWGNRCLRYLYAPHLTMVTGMTRAYRAGIIQNQKLTEDGKEIHLEIAHRLIGLGYKIGEVPAVLSWPDPEPATGVSKHESRAKRTNWSKIFRLIRSHLAFGVLRGVSKIVLPAIVLLTVSILFFGGWSIRNYVTHGVAAYLVLFTVSQMILWVMMVMGYFQLYHALQNQIETWRTQELEIRGLRARGERAEAREYYRRLRIEPGGLLLPERTPRDRTTNPAHADPVNSDSASAEPAERTTA